MLEKALTGSRSYWTWVGVLLAVMAIGALNYLRQINEGLVITGLSRDITWGFYIAQFTFLVGVAASAVMVVLPYYLHNYKTFGKITVLGEFLAIAAVLMCLMFIIADLGQPQRALNIILYATPNSILFWDMVVLNGYLVLNVIITRVTLNAERKSVPPPKWIKPVILLSIPWAVSIHTVTAFIYNGLGGRPFWFTAIMAPRFLATAFSAGPALLVLVCLILRKYTRFDAGKEAIQKLGTIITYAMLTSVFFTLLEVFTAFYSGSPEHMEPFKYLYAGLEGHTTLVPWMWTSLTLSLLAIVLLVNPAWRRNESLLAIACAAVFAGIWIEKGLGMVVAGFVPNPLGHIAEYRPTLPEVLIGLGIWATGFLLVTMFYKIALTLRGQVAR